MAMWAGVQNGILDEQKRRIDEARNRGGETAAKAEAELIKQEKRDAWKTMAGDALTGAKVGSTVPVIGTFGGAVAGSFIGALARSVFGKK